MPSAAEMIAYCQEQLRTIRAEQAAHAEQVARLEYAAHAYQDVINEIARRMAAEEGTDHGVEFASHMG